MILFNPSNRKEHIFNFRKDSGEEQSTCPECSESRQKKDVKCFSYNHEKKVGHCIHCNCCLVPKKEFEPKKEYKRPPKWANKTELSANLVKWFESRKIEQKTLIDFQISEGLEFMPQAGKELNTIQFNYFRGGELVNVKYRDGKKRFKLFKDGELILYNLDSIKETEEVIICEGELDAMAIHQGGFKNVVSVPNGAGLNRINLEYLDNCIDHFFNKKKILIATDNDAAGRNLQEQLADRLGKERCYKVVFKDCKDANDCLIKYGIQGIIESIADKKEFPLEGIFTIKDYASEINDIYEHGLPKGAKTMMTNLNNLVTFHDGYMTVVTGIPSHGKSAALDQIILQLSLTEDSKGGIYSPENRPVSLHISNLARKLIGKSWWGDCRISKTEIELAKSYLNERFFFIRPEKSFTLRTILDYFKQLILKYGIKWGVIDAFNKLDHKHSGDDYRYIGECLDEITAFCEFYKFHLFIVAHPRKMMKEKGTQRHEVPNLYDISGSSTWFDKADVGICVYRDFDAEISRWYVQKVKYQHWGKTGFCEFKYDNESGRFNEHHGALTTWDKTPWIYRPKETPKVGDESQEKGIIFSDIEPPF